MTDAGELKSLADHKITEFSMREQYVWDEDNGNHVFASGSFVKDGEIQETQAVFFDTQQEYTVFDYPEGWVASDTVQGLPTLSGGGRVNPLDCMINQKENNHVLPTLNYIAA